MTVLPGSTLQQPALGFGCAYLKGGFATPSSKRLVHAAIAEGIRHFDVAPLYGSGTAEAALGQALSGRRHEVTITSKVGIARPAVSAVELAVRSMLAPVASRLRARAARASPSMSMPTSSDVETRFDFAFVAASVERTLADLGTDYLDALLLHEAGPEDISSALVDYLLQGRASGRFRAIGVGSERHRAEAIATAFPGLFDLYQYSWNALATEPARLSDAVFSITHRSVMGGLPMLQARLQTEPSLRQGMRDNGLDPQDHEQLPQLLLAAAIHANPQGMTLVASRNKDRIVANARVIHDSALIEAGGVMATLLATTRPANNHDN